MPLVYTNLLWYFHIDHESPRIPISDDGGKAHGTSRQQGRGIRWQISLRNRYVQLDLMELLGSKVGVLDGKFHYGTGMYN